MHGRFRSFLALGCAGLFLADGPVAKAALFAPGVTSNTPPWPGGMVPYEFDAGITPTQQMVYLDGLREWELAGDITFVPRTAETSYLLLRFDPGASDNTVTGSAPQVMTLNTLTRSQTAHEMGHSLGIEHEHVRPDRDSFITVLTNNIIPGRLPFFEIPSNHTAFESYDFASVMHFSRNLFSIDPANLDAMQPKPPNEEFLPKLGNFALSRGDRAAAAHLYGPGPTLVPVVTNTADVGVGSLRAALYCALDNPGTTITFNIPTNDPGFNDGIYTIELSGFLPPMAHRDVTIDATTQPGYSNQPVVFLSGNALIPEAENVFGLTFYSTNCAVRGLAVSGFPDSGMLMLYPEAVSNRVEGCFVGTDAAGTAANANGFHGIGIFEGASDNVIGGTHAASRNVISGNAQYGVLMIDSNTTGNRVIGNYIGTDAAGSGFVPNGLSGVGIFKQAKNNTVGDASEGALNVISGNTEYGVLINDAGSTGNVVIGNYIGLDAAGVLPLLNMASGVGIFLDASDCRVGGTSPGERNVISGNAFYGVLLTGTGTTNISIRGNYIGTDASGSNRIDNSFAGIGIFGGSGKNTIGGDMPGSGNVISGNGWGLLIEAPGGNVIQGNRIGTDPTGTLAVDNASGGILLSAGTRANLIGGTTAGAGNQVSGNSGPGLFITGSGTSSNRVEGNLIGTDAGGTHSLENMADGIFITDQASGNIIGLDVAGTGVGNRIAFNPLAGILLFQTAGTGNTIRGNSITSNGFLGIDLGEDMPPPGPHTPNDADDLDTGANNLQNFPVITNVVAWGPATVMQGVLTSRTDRSYILDFYRNAAPDSLTGFGEGEFHAGSTSVATGSNGIAGFSFGIEGVFTDQFFSATATDASTGDTSEFPATPQAVPATQGPPQPVFSGGHIQSGTFTFTATFESGWPYHAEYTTNAVNWLELTNFIPTGTAIDVNDMLDPDSDFRFFRLVSP